jgi:hypothetical protein
VSSANQDDLFFGSVGEQNATSRAPGPEWAGLGKKLISACDYGSDEAVGKQFLDLLLWSNDKSVQ